MSYYLSMDGVDDYLQCPSMQFDDIEIDMNYHTKEAENYVFDARTGMQDGLIYSGTYKGGLGNFNGGSGNKTYINGLVIFSSSEIPRDTRAILKATRSSLFTDDVTFFARNNIASFGKGYIYDIKFYNGGTLQAHYNMTTGTVLDQSGNNRHANLTGGTWIKVDEGPPDNGEPPLKDLKDCVSLESWETRGGEAVILIDETPPESVSNIRVTHLEQSRLLLHWTESISSDVKDFKIYNGSTVITTVLATVSKLQPLSYPITDLTSSTDYVFTIVARDYSNNEAHGVSINIRTHGTYALSMNGTNDFVKLPLLTFDTVEITCLIMYNGTLMDARPGISTAFYGLSNSGQITHSTSLFKDGGYILYDDEIAYNKDDAINNKITITLKLRDVGTDDVNIYSRYTNSDFMKGKLYFVKILLGDRLVAAYNFTERFAGSSVIDISGNGHTAFLTGGTWVME